MNTPFWIKIEHNILKDWQKSDIFSKIEKKPKRKRFIFYEGPPFVNAPPHIGHFFSRVIKDIILRYKTMQGFYIDRRAGWDTHGLPIELQVEKILRIKNKKVIEKIGIDKFIKECKRNIFTYKKEWEKFTERIGYWLDLKNPYITCDNDYIETVWWIIKQIWQKGLLEKDYKVIPYCPRCGTSLSSHEVALGYEKIKESAIYLKFPILNPEFKNTSLLVWTTTPWTLPGNVAIALNEKFIYCKIKKNEEYLILAKERLKALGNSTEIVQEFKGKDLTNLYYQAPYPIESQKKITIYKTLSADFVSLKEGTGLVHIAPAFGEEDMKLIKMQNAECKMQNLPEFPVLLTVDEEGKFRLEVKKWAGTFVKEADPLIIEDLKNRNLFFKEELYEHDYPFCWRCHSPLLYYSKESWFIKMTKLKNNLIKNNQKINWIPNYLKEGRFGQWLKEIKDWTLNRERYWGTPLPIWHCQQCKNLELIGSLKDLLNQNFSTNRYFILRHGESLNNIKDIGNCWPEKIYCPLTKRGEKQIKKIAKDLKKKKIELIFSSDLLRTKQTAEIIEKELGLTSKFDKRLREINVGILNGKPLKEIRKFWDKEGRLSPLECYLKHFQSSYPKGESYTDLKKRMYEFIKEIDKKYQEKNILIISHHRPLSLLEKANYGFDLKQLTKIILEKKEIKVGEIRELKFKNLPYNKKMELDFHRPYLDQIEFYCQKCGGLMKRVSEVIDCWFDSGAMPFAQYHYPFENKNLIDKKIQFPADYISEAVDQTRGWFYTLLAISTLLGLGPAYKNVISFGHVLDEKGEKMSKSKGNAVNPWHIIEKYGADATRWYFYTINQPSDSKLFSEKDIEQVLKKFILILWNSYLFFETYNQKSKIKIKIKNQNLLDQWIISRLNGLILKTTNSLDKYDITSSARLIENFVINDLSLWYLRRSRRRFQKPKTEKELREASQVFNFIFFTLIKLTAPFIPFLSEEIYQRISNFQFSGPHSFRSIHLEKWPRVNKKLINKNLERKMEKVREVVNIALAERVKAKIKVRQPLNELQITNYELKKELELLELIKDEVNVKKIVFGKVLKLDTRITSELKEEGIVREIIRHLQEMRKKAGLKPKDKILIRYSTTPFLTEILKRNEETILKEARIKNFRFSEKKEEKFDLEEEIKIDQENLWLSIKKF